MGLSHEVSFYSEYAFYYYDKWNKIQISSWILEVQLICKIYINFCKLALRLITTNNKGQTFKLSYYNFDKQIDLYCVHCYKIW